MPDPTARLRSVTAVMVALVLLAATVHLAVQQQRLRFDPTNAAMRSVDTPEAAASARLARGFGGERPVLLVYSALPGLAISAAEQETLRQLTEEFASSPAVRQVEPLPLQDPSVATVRVWLRTGAELDAWFTSARASCPASLVLHVSGQPMVEQAIAARTAAERSAVVPWIAGVLTLLLALLYRSLRLALLALLPGALAIVWTEGLLACLGRQLDPVAVLLGPVLLTVGVAAGVHSIEAWRRQLIRGASHTSAAGLAQRELMLPATLAAITTMVGFWALAWNPIPAVAEFGVVAAFGVGLVHLFALGLLPPLLGRFGPRTLPEPALGRGAARWCRVLAAQRVPILVATTFLATLAGALWLRLRVDNDPLQLLARSDPARIEYDAVSARLGAADSFHLLCPQELALRQPDRLAAFAARVAAASGIAGPIPPLRRSTSGDLALEYALAPGGSAARSALFASIRDDARQLGLSGVAPAGDAVQVAIDSSRLVHGHLLGLSVTATALFVVMAAGLRSVRLALLGMVPNVLPCVLLYGTLAVLDAPLTVAASMIGSVLLGLVIDNTIHLLHHHRRAAGSVGDAAAMTQAFVAVARPIHLSGIVLGCGFAAALGGGMQSTQEFGAMAAAVVAFAWFGDAVLLPVLLLRPAKEVRA